MKRKVITLEIICYAVILLFAYAALSKLFLYNIYVKDLERSPFIGPYAAYLSLTLPVAELALSALLFFESTRRIGLWGSLVLMILFTGYVGLILGAVDSRPCTCGGLIRNLTWQQHFALNVTYTLLIALGIWLQKSITPSWQKN
ncbi:hypothetical protein GO495_06740 [Chitinophaga oryziterrae]|uniref:Methylamine utilisation protein MauE domain-containing protein n=1 Tax=Chitinophaga oryziterrae TaxID=1031224 RepID=A0A6N8J7V0_9BACT|nr:MauE/DoxX family redox-associated membrane protein [Chitinophaga oryziterrae]MVT40272.1 hypothetical protein [Chitinophaga oryziterrae]